MHENIIETLLILLTGALIIFGIYTAETGKYGEDINISTNTTTTPVNEKDLDYEFNCGYDLWKRKFRCGLGLFYD